MSLLEQDACAVGAETGPASDQRRDPRHLCIDGGILRLAVRPEFRGRRAVIVDVSVSGIGFVLEHRVESATTLVFELQGGSGLISRIAHVRHCRPHPIPADAPWVRHSPAVSNFMRRLFGLPRTPKPEHAWLVGCEFDRPLDDAELQHLLDQLRGMRLRER